MLKINEDFKSLIPPLSVEEFKQLESNCIEEGIRDKIITWNGFIIDGHNRYEISQRWDLDYETESKSFNDEIDVRIWMRNNQKGRRNLSKAWVIELELGNKEDLALKGEAIRVEKISHFRQEGETLSQNDNIPKHNTQKEIAKAAGVSTGMIAMSEIVKDKSPELWEKAKDGEITVTTAYKEIKKDEKKAEYKAKIQETRVETIISENIKNGDSLEILESLEDGCIDVVLTDPPYGISYKSNRSMFDEAITKRGLLNDGKDEAFDLLDKTCEILQRKTATNAHLYFFCSWNVFSSFESIIGKYFTIKTPIVWDKGNKGSGDLENDWGNQTELIIYCVKGKKLVNNRRGNVINVSRLHTSKMVHPTQKPTDLLKQILEVSAANGDFIVDPFMGSGSTIKAANELGYKSLGIELDKQMFNIANTFINE